MKTLRIAAVTLALSLMLGELWRSWGAGRPMAFILDDQIMGAILISGAWMMQTPTPKRHAYFAVGWGIIVGMLYGSFFNKVFAPSLAQEGNWNLGILTFLIGIAFITSILGLIGTLLTFPNGGIRRSDAKQLLE